MLNPFTGFLISRDIATRWNGNNFRMNNDFNDSLRTSLCVDQVKLIRWLTFNDSDVNQVKLRMWIIFNDSGVDHVESSEGILKASSGSHAFK